MATVRIEFETGEAAWAYGFKSDCNKLLQEVNRLIYDGHNEAPIVDSNGNTVGTVTVE